MPTFAIPNFKFGLDQRRPRVAGALSTLWDAQNCHLTRGGDIERNKSFVPQYVLPAGTFGMVAVSTRLYVFGSASSPAGLPAGLNYQQLIPGDSSNMVDVLAAVAFLGNTYVIAEFDNGTVHHFYNATLVPGWEVPGGISDLNSSFASLTDYLANKVTGDPAVEAQSYGNTVLITTEIPGVATTITATAVNQTGGVNDQTATVSVIQAAVAAVAETLSTGTITITGGSASPGVNTFLNAAVGAVPLLLAPVDWVGSNSATANAVAAQINNLTNTSGYSASSVGAVVTISAKPGTGATPNGGVVTATVQGNVTASETNLAGGVTAVASVAQIATVVLGGTYETLDIYRINIGSNAYVATGRASGTGLSTYVFANRIYSCANTHLKYCAINNPADWTTVGASSGAGFINIASQTAGSERLNCVAPYSNYSAIFSSQSVRLYNLTADATQVTFFQSIEHTGAIAPLSVQAFANTDVFYLATSGIRSLRERDTTFEAYAADVGAAIDTPMQAWLASVGPTAAFKGVSAFEPLDQRYWFAVGARIWVYSYFPASNVAAWSYYSPTDLSGNPLSISAFGVIKNRIYCRAGDVIYLYGGLTGDVYPAAGIMPPSFQTPFLSTGDPESFKSWTTFDVASTGLWQVTLLVDPNDYTKTVNGGIVVNNTLSGPVDNVVGHSPTFALNMSCTSGGYASFSGFFANYAEKHK